MIPKRSMILRINGQNIDDILEYRFYNDLTKTRRIIFQYQNTEKEILFQPEQKIMIDIETPKYQRCENNCNFCFINGLPSGLRKELYFRDDDYRLSFMFGNFISMTNLDTADIDRIARLRLSPLYISVHTTDPNLRIDLFKNKRAGLILEQIQYLVNNNIQLHCQIVVIPGVNDDHDLLKTIKDLSRFYPGVQSIGVVPVGKTVYLPKIQTLGPRQSRNIVQNIKKMHDLFRRKYKRGLVYASDEMYIKSNLPLPASDYYDDFPQYENGIGIVRTFLDQIEICQIEHRIRNDYLFLTGRMAFPFLNQLKAKLESSCFVKGRIDVQIVDNTLFGDHVSVAGLIPGRDFMKKIESLQRPYDKILLPPYCVNDTEHFLDDMVLDQHHIMIAPPTIRGLIKCLQ